MRREHLKSTIKIVAGAGIAYSFFRFASNPKSKFYHKFPKKKIKNVHLLPNVKIVRKDKEYHLHHWINATAFYTLYLMKKRRFSGWKFFHGLMIGTILQGLTYGDRFRIVRKRSVAVEEIVNEV